MKLIFNSSMPRSGSELLQVILHQNPRIYGSSTSPLLEYQFAARSMMKLAEVKSQPTDLMRDAFNSMCASMAEGYYAAITDRPIVCDKSRGWVHYYEWVHRWNPNPKMICMVRDLRAIIASMERIFRSNRDSPETVDDPANLANITFYDRIRHWLRSPPIGLALRRTADLFQREVAQHILFVRYEDLLADPANTLRLIYSYIGEPYYEHDFDNIEKVVVEDSSYFGIFGNHSVLPKLAAPKHQSWASIMSPEACEIVKTHSPWYFRKFGYQEI